MQKVHKLLENKNKENKKIKPPVAGKPTVASKPAKREGQYSARLYFDYSGHIIKLPALDACLYLGKRLGLPDLS